MVKNAETKGVWKPTSVTLGKYGSFKIVGKMLFRVLLYGEVRIWRLSGLYLCSRNQHQVSLA